MAKAQPKADASKDDVDALIHHYGADEKGDYHLDDDGDPMVGWYWELRDKEGKLLTRQIGPYSSREEAEAAVKKSADEGTYLEM